MFKDVLRVEVELFGFCNRKCVWCPNREFDRTSNDAVLNKAVFRNMLIDLQNNGFATPVRETGFVRMTNSIISFNGYCEPMSNPKLINEYASVVKEVFGSDVDIYFNSNGDYFNKTNIECLSEVDCIKIMDYDNKGKLYWRNKLESTGASIVQRRHDKITAIHNIVDYISVHFNWKDKQLEDRGGFFNTSSDLVSEIGSMNWAGSGIRDTPCIEPVYFLTISHTGDVMPCCHLRQDNPEHRKYIMGNIYDDKISEIVKRHKYKNFRDSVLNCNFPKHCRNCHKNRQWYLKGKDISRINVEIED